MHKILIVEDTLAIREEVCDILLMEGYCVFQAENGKIGVDMALQEHPDLIISDILMPEFNGFEMFSKLQEHKKTRTIPLIFLSAKGEKEDIRSGMNLGAEDYLTKPININDLVNAVENKIKKKLIRDQKIIDKTRALSITLQNQKNQLDNFNHLISNGLQSSQRNVLELLTATQVELESTNNFNDSNSNINKRWTNLGYTRFNTINTNTIAERVIDETSRSPHISIKIKNELPKIFANDKMLEKIFEVLIQHALEHINKNIGLIELACETTEEEHVFSINYNYVRINTNYPEKIFTPQQLTNPTDIGLYIVKKIISHYNGKIHVKSCANKETTFYFNLPRINNNV
ncbi:response regulator [Polaribacter sp. IC073]|uniref:response regulator n=1 Tax=Polaribacter sp. IC073 TaxID=2508540 RepID=UPI0011BF2922|nr:response regulator [Polaribacter sp. IC073]TXD46866.1 response regulator [Polaribacter sp. IC073]